MAKNNTNSRQVKTIWLETKREYEIENGVEVLKHVTKEKKKLEWYNSSLFLWLLGFLFLTFIPWVWNKFQEYKEKEQRIEKLDNEIKGRFSQLFNMISRLSDSSKHNANDVLKNLTAPVGGDTITAKDMFFQFINSPKDTKGRMKFHPSYKEFDDYSTVTLLNELVTLLDTSNQKEIKIEISRLTYPSYIPTRTNWDNQKLIKVIKDSLYLERWRKLSLVAEYR